MAVKRNLDIIPGCICGSAGWTIASSSLYQALCKLHGNVEIWPSLCAPSGGWNYYWLVSYKNEVVKELAFIRFSCPDMRIQEQIEGPFKTEIWIDVPPGPASHDELAKAVARGAQ
jgi:hypothetical protein